MPHLKRSSSSKHLLRKTTAGNKHLVKTCTACPCDLGGGCCLNPSATYSGTWSADARGNSPCDIESELCASQVTSGSFSGTMNSCFGFSYTHVDPGADTCQEWSVNIGFSGDGSGGWLAAGGMDIPCTTGTSIPTFIGGSSGASVAAACPGSGTQTFDLYINGGPLVGSVSVSFSNYAAIGCTCTSALP